MFEFLVLLAIVLPYICYMFVSIYIISMSRMLLSTMLSMSLFMLIPTYALLDTLIWKHTLILDSICMFILLLNTSFKSRSWILNLMGPLFILGNVVYIAYLILRICNGTAL